MIELIAKLFFVTKSSLGDSETCAFVGVAKENQNMNHLKSAILTTLLALATFTKADAQTLIATTDQNLLPLYLTDGTTAANRSGVAALLTLNGLSANTTYNYMTGAQTNAATNPTTGTLPGNAVYVTSSGNVTSYSSGKSLTTSPNFGTFTTDANGAYKGWFGLVTTSGGSGTIFAAAKNPYLYLQMSNTTVSGTAGLLNLRTTDSFTSIGNPGTAGTATFFYGAATLGGSTVGDKKFFALWDNVAGSGRPLAASWSELDGLSIGTSTDGILTSSGSFGTYIPTTSTVKRVEFFNADGSSLGFLTNDSGFTGTTGTATSVASTLNVGTVALVPEPSSASLLLLGGFGLIALRRLSRKS
jgi:PEP-CTERM motif